MASILMDIPVEAPAETVWNALSNAGSAHLVFAGVLTACDMEDAEVRAVTFANGFIVRERIVDIDPIRRRIAYTVLNAFEHAS